MTKLEKLYNSIQALKELGATLPEEFDRPDRQAGGRDHQE